MERIIAEHIDNIFPEMWKIVVFLIKTVLPGLLKKVKCTFLVGIKIVGISKLAGWFGRFPAYGGVLGHFDGYPTSLINRLTFDVLIGECVVHFSITLGCSTPYGRSSSCRRNLHL